MFLFLVLVWSFNPFLWLNLSETILVQTTNLSVGWPQIGLKNQTEFEKNQTEILNLKNLGLKNSVSIKIKRHNAPKELQNEQQKMKRNNNIKSFFPFDYLPIMTSFILLEIVFRKHK